MSLIVDLFVFNPAKERCEYLNAVEINAAGFESYRHELWGSAALINCGARFFPQLRDNDLWVFPDDLPAFKEECEMVRRSAADIATELWSQRPRHTWRTWCTWCAWFWSGFQVDRRSEAEQIREYMDRFLAAVELAQKRDAGVCIS